MKKSWCIPPTANAAFVCQMEDVLDVYMRPYDAQRPQVCMDETSKQLLSEKREPLPSRSGREARFDYEYEREGVANLFMFSEPLGGWRHVSVTKRRTAQDWAAAMRDLSDLWYPQADKIVVVLDNLNTHTPAAFYEAFEPSEARRLARRFEFHYTPKHGSWLNMAEIELSVLARQCLDQRIATQEMLAAEIQAWQERRNALAAKIDWRFTAEDARIKLKHLYPKIQD